MVKRKDPRRGKIILYIFTVVFAVAYIIIGRQIAMNGYPAWEQAADESYKAKVTAIISDTPLDNGHELVFEAQALSGPERDKLVQVRQTIYENYYPVQQAVQIGDKILFYADPYRDDSQWQMLDYLRSDAIIWLALAFAAAVVAFGRMKGLNTLISLAFTCLAVFAVFIPSILSGQNIYLWSSLTCVYIIVMTMLFINGAGKKSLAAGAGCAAGVVMAGLLTLLMDGLLNLTGMVNEDTLYLQMIDTAQPIDLNGVIFAAIIIGALGAIMDVAMDIASSMNEIRLNSPDISGKRLIGSGFNIGRDVMGTMANTLVLAYIGGSLSTTLLLVAYNVSPLTLFNMELIVVELLQALAGSIGILLTIPLTSFICAALYPRSVQ